MPKKTKRQKIIAEHHRKMLFSGSPSSLAIDSSLPQRAPSEHSQTFQFHSSMVRPNRLPTEDMNELRAIRYDLVKTIFLAACAIGIEITVYWRGIH